MITGGLLLLLVVLAGVGVLYQWRTSTADRAHYTPPGDLVTVHGRQIHIYCQGEGSPTVILDAGQGGWSISWAEIMPQLSSKTQVCAYDRAGYGWSHPAPDARTPQDAADDLAALLDAATIAGPYVLVGFSHAGLSTRLFAAQHPEEVVGMVLVDPATEFDNELLNETLRQQQESTVGIFRLFGWAAHFGIIRLLDPREMAPYAPFIAEDPAQPEIYYSFITKPTWWQTSAKEFASRLDDEMLEYVRTNGRIRDIPLIVIGATSPPDGENDFAPLTETRLSLLEELAARSSQGQFILAENSSHEIVRDRPDVVIAAVQRMVDWVKH